MKKLNKNACCNVISHFFILLYYQLWVELLYVLLLDVHVILHHLYMYMKTTYQAKRGVTFGWGKSEIKELLKNCENDHLKWDCTCQCPVATVLHITTIVHHVGVKFNLIRFLLIEEVTQLWLEVFKGEPIDEGITAWRYHILPEECLNGGHWLIQVAVKKNV